MVSALTPIRGSNAAQRPEILIVEDEQTSRRALSLLLAASGYEPQAFRTAEEALRQFNLARHPRIALIDLDLPGMNGLDLISRLEKLDPSIFPVLITATDADTLATRLHGRPVAYLRKPLDFELLLNLLADQPNYMRN